MTMNDIRKRTRVTKQVIQNSGLLFDDEVKIIFDNEQLNKEELLEIASKRMNQFVSGKFPLVDNGDNTFSFFDDDTKLNMTFNFMTSVFSFMSHSLKKLEISERYSSANFTLELAKGVSNAISFINQAFYDAKKNPMESYQISYTPEGKAIAIFTEHYNKQDHLPIIISVVDNGLVSDLSYMHIDHNGMALGIYQGDNKDKQNTIKVYFEIVNGVSGKDALSIRPVIRTNANSKISIELPFKRANRKHMSKVGEALDAIYENLSNLSEFNYEQKLNEMSNYQLWAHLDTAINQLVSDGADEEKLRDYYSIVKGRCMGMETASEIIYDILDLIGGDSKKHGSAKWLTMLINQFNKIVFILPS